MTDKAFPIADFSKNKSRRRQLADSDWLWSDLMQDDLIVLFNVELWISAGAVAGGHQVLAATRRDIWTCRAAALGPLTRLAGRKEKPTAVQ